MNNCKRITYNGFKNICMMLDPIIYYLPFKESIASLEVTFPLELVASQEYRPSCLSLTEYILSTEVALSFP